MLIKRSQFHVLLKHVGIEFDEKYVLNGLDTCTHVGEKIESLLS